MIPEYESKIGFRLSTKERQQIKQLIDDGKFKSLSQVIRAALKESLKTG
jgi:Arc/MetJ-type ribon-helix-helix transcriptional regulator